VSQARYTAGVVGVIFNQVGKILVVEHVFHPNWSWGLPGGWLGRGEDPAAALGRELREETGIHITVLRPLLVQAGYRFTSHLDISFICRTEEDVVSISPELLSYAWLEPNAMPRLLPFHVASIEAAQQPGMRYSMMSSIPAAQRRSLQFLRSGSPWSWCPWFCS
jgi:ADP-ribose pyrophosphatase YjhB (NUDIX family)